MNLTGILASCGGQANYQQHQLVTLTPSDTPFPSLTPVNTRMVVATLTATFPPLPISTEVPQNTPEPTRDPWPAELAAPGQSRIGIHVLLNDDPRIMQFVRVAKPRVVKAVDNLGWLADVKQASPQTITIGRHTDVPNRNVLDNKTPDQYPDPAQFATEFINLYLSEFQTHGAYVDYWEGWNEFPPNSPAEWDWYAAFEAERACQMQALGFKAAVGGFSSGTPEYVDMERFLPAIEAAYRCGGIFTLHEYSSPVMQYGVGGGIPGAPDHINQMAGALTLRYRYWYEGYLKPRNLVIPLVISEAGIDSWVGEGCPADPGQGWYGCIKDWAESGNHAPAWEIYLSQIRWYDQQLQQDEYVVGFTLFTAGTSNVNEWRTFDINDMLVPLAIEIASQS